MAKRLKRFIGGTNKIGITIKEKDACIPTWKLWEICGEILFNRTLLCRRDGALRAWISCYRIRALNKSVPISFEQVYL
jgi:hypothetical protein